MWPHQWSLTMPDQETNAAAAYLGVLRELSTTLAELTVAVDRHDEHNSTRHEAILTDADHRHKSISTELRDVVESVKPLIAFVESERVRRELEIEVNKAEMVQQNIHEDMLLEADIASKSLRNRVLWGIVSAIGLSLAGGLTAWFTMLSTLQVK